MLILEDIKNIESSLFEFSVALTKAIDEYKELNMSKEEVNELINKFENYVNDTKETEMRFYCQE